MPPVEVRELKPGEYISLKRGDILTAGRPSAAAREVVAVAGLNDGACADLDKPAPACREALARAAGISQERRLSTLAELWTQQALATTAAGGSPEDGLRAWMEAARYAYAYLFFTERDPRDRAFEDRQGQVRDYYNLAVQSVATGMFSRFRREPGEKTFPPEIALADWIIHPDASALHIFRSLGFPEELVPASSLAFSGLRSQYRRDGFGAELVVVTERAADMPPPAVETDPGPCLWNRSGQVTAWSKTPYPTLTMLLRFDEPVLEDVLATKNAVFAVYDPYGQAVASLQGQTVPLAGHFTAGYGLWLARSGFARQSLRTLLGFGEGIERPRLYLMQPYDPQRRILVMIHGLASSPEAWVNVANEIVGDELLREHFQVWLIHYPTNMPIALNQAGIRRALESALAHLDPHGGHAASRGMVLIGHSMGGVIARLLVSSSGGDRLLDRLTGEAETRGMRCQRLKQRLMPVLEFEPLPQADRAVFIATPHRGTRIAGERSGRWLSRMIRLPLAVLESFADVLQDARAGTGSGNDPARLPNSVDNLREDDPFVLAAADLEISPRVRYHSIIARSTADGRLEMTDDGLVPYRSAHLAGAVSEKVIVAGHSVQETVPSILELRRILHEDIRSRPAADDGTGQSRSSHDPDDQTSCDGD